MGIIIITLIWKAFFSGQQDRRRRHHHLHSINDDDHRTVVYKKRRPLLSRYQLFVLTLGLAVGFYDYKCHISHDFVSGVKNLGI